jgi:hypothetical protein
MLINQYALLVLVHDALKRVVQHADDAWACLLHFTETAARDSGAAADASWVAEDIPFQQASRLPAESIMS